jgi:hypothetical protein
MEASDYALRVSYRHSHEVQLQGPEMLAGLALPRAAVTDRVETVPTDYRGEFPEFRGHR